MKLDQSYSESSQGFNENDFSLYEPFSHVLGSMIESEVFTETITFKSFTHSSKAQRKSH